MAGITNRGKLRIVAAFFKGVDVPTAFYIHLCTAATTPTADTNLLSELTQIADGNGYAQAGKAIAFSDFKTAVEDDSGDKGTIQLNDVIWTAVSGSMPASGAGARWAVLCDTKALGSREVLVFWDLVSDRTISETQTLTLQNCEIDATE